MYICKHVYMYMFACIHVCVCIHVTVILFASQKVGPSAQLSYFPQANKRHIVLTHTLKYTHVHKTYQFSTLFTNNTKLHYPD